MWERLVEVLTKMLDLYRILLEVSKQKQQVLISADTKELDTITKQEEMVIVQIGKLETARAQVVQEIASAHNLPGGDKVTVSCLAAIADAKNGEALKQLWRQFEAEAAELAKLNAMNTKLLDQALFYINYNINLLTQSAVGPTYAAKGQDGQAAANRAVVDRKV